MTFGNFRSLIRSLKIAAAPWITPLALVTLIGCGRSDATATADSTLSRDLTLATSAIPPSYVPTLSDTAVSAPANRGVTRPASTGVAAKAPPPAPTGPSTAAKTARARPVAPAKTEPAKTPTPAQRPQPLETKATNTASEESSGVSATSSGTAGPGNRRVIGSGSVLAGRTNAEICSLANKPGDRLVAALSDEVVGPNGARLPVGTPILVEMAPPTADGAFVFRVKAVQVAGVLMPVEGTVAVAGETRERQVSKGGDKGKVIGGAVAGAILGRVLGGGTKGTIIGAAGGAAAGTMAAARNTVTEQCLPSGATVTITLTAPLVLTEGVP